MAKKRLKVEGRWSAAYAVASDYLESSYTYDGEGRMLSQVYPSAHDPLGTTEVAGATLTYGFDNMGRPTKMGQGANPTQWISDVTYNASSQPLTIASTNAQVNQETRAYNALGQLTSLTSGSVRFDYDFSPTANDGRITAEKTYGNNNVLQATVSYTYDSLNRLSSASGTGTTTWGANYGYDGFGNLLTVTPSGQGPSSLNVTVNPATNRVNGWSYDANGNVTAMPGGIGGAVYDIENRLMEATKNASVKYGYGADNRRIFESKRGTVNGGGDTIEEVVTWWSGQRIGRYKIRWNSEAPNNGAPNSFVLTRVEAENVYFGSKPLRLGAETNILVDRLGSVRRSNFFPYGQEMANSGADKEKYATYRHDGATDLSYADQRYYATGAGRFMTADPYKASAGAAEPGSWNRYAYVRGEPLGRVDPGGLADFEVTGYCIGCSGIPGPVGGGGGGGANVPSLEVPPDFDGFQNQSGGGGSQGTGGVTQINNIRRHAAIDMAWAGIQAAFRNPGNSGCAKWFDAAVGTSDNRSYGSIDNVLENIIPALSAAGSFVGGNANAVANSALTPGVLIAVSDGGAFFNPLQTGTTIASSDDFESEFASVNGNSDRARVFILLHELGHVVGSIRSNDGLDTAAGRRNQRHNNDAIWRNCGTVIKAFSNTPY